MKLRAFALSIALVLLGLLFASERRTRAPVKVAPVGVPAPPRTAAAARPAAAPAPLPPSPTPIPECAGNEVTTADVLERTNAVRRAHGENGLRPNDLLNQAADARLADMFDREYFAHVSPVGAGAQQAVRELGYDFLTVGENLAKGGFHDAVEVVQGWIDSPPHRANLLRRGFQEIGVAAAKGYLDGQCVWVAVQIFATPAAACPRPNAVLRQEIESSVRMSRDWFWRLRAARAAIDQSEPDRALLEDYSGGVAAYNELVELNSEYIQAYNAEVEAYRRCIDAVGAGGE